MTIDHQAQEVELSGLIMDLIKISYKDQPRISCSCVMRIDHRSNKVEVQGLIIDVMKLSYHN